MTKSTKSYLRQTEGLDISALLYFGCQPQFSLKNLPEAQRTEHCLGSASGFKTETAKRESLWKDKIE